MSQLDDSAARETLVNPRPDVRHDVVLAEIVEQIVEVPLVKFQGLVLRSSRLMKELAPARHRCLVSGAVHYEHRQSNLAE